MFIIMDAAGFGKDGENALHVPCVFATIGASIRSTFFIRREERNVQTAARGAREAQA